MITFARAVRLYVTDGEAFKGFSLYYLRISEAAIQRCS